MKPRYIQHLFLRAGFGIGYTELMELQEKSRAQVIRDLVSKSENPEPLEVDTAELKSAFVPFYRQKNLKDNKTKLIQFQKESRIKIRELNHAWIDRLKTTNQLLNEKMTLFWANVFVCRDNNIFYIQRYNNTLRQHALGNFRTLVKDMAKEAAMSRYLNNRQNVKESPNENFARELMELFTLGIGNYNEQDIKEAARAFTGWSFRVNGDFFLRKNKHDYGVKTFFGKTGDFNGDDIIDIILDQKQCARFVCSKIYKYFVNPEIDKQRLEELTTIFHKDYDIKNLMQYIFESDWFYENTNIGVKIKSPIELLVGIQRTVPVEFEKKKQLIYLQKMMGQILLYPPNVAGWKGDKNWIDSNTLMFRLKLPSLLLNNAVINLDEKGDFEDTYEMYYKNQKNKTRYLKIKPNWEVFHDQYTHISGKELKDILIISKIDKDTEAFLSNLKIESNREFCIQLMSIPEYQMC